MSYISAISLLDTQPIGTLKCTKGSLILGLGGGAIFFSRYPTHTICTVYQGEGWSGWGGGAGLEAASELDAW